MADEEVEEPEPPSESEQDFEAIEGSTTLTRADFAEVVEYLPGFKRSWWGFALLALAMLLFSGLSFAPAYSSLIPAALMVALLFYFQGFRRRDWVKRAYEQLGGDTSFRFDEFGLHVDAQLRQHRLAWQTLLRVRLETPRSFLIYTSPQAVFVIPKRAFAAADIARIRELCAERVDYRPAETRGTASLKSVALVYVGCVLAFLGIWSFLRAGSPGEPARQRTQPEPAATADDDAFGGADASDDYGDGDGGSDGHAVDQSLPPESLRRLTPDP
jgi:hypothetical protein